MLKCIIVDDEFKSRETLKKMLSEFCQGVEVAATCASVDEAKKAIAENNPDLVFLDVQMEGETGFDLLQQLDTIDFAVVFTTAYSEFAIQAIKFAAVDYLLKPIDVSELQQAVTKVGSKKASNVMDQMRQLIANMSKPNVSELKLGLPSAEGLNFVKVSEIMYMKASGNYTEIYLTESRKVLVSKNLKEYDDMLADYNFFRIHHSFLINMNFVKSYVRGEGGYVIMNDGVSLDVSRRRKDAFLDKMR